MRLLRFLHPDDLGGGDGGGDDAGGVALAPGADPGASGDAGSGAPDPGGASRGAPAGAPPGGDGGLTGEEQRYLYRALGGQEFHLPHSTVDELIGRALTIQGERARIEADRKAFQENQKASQVEIELARKVRANPHLMRVLDDPELLKQLTGIEEDSELAQLRKEMRDMVAPLQQKQQEEVEFNRSRSALTEVLTSRPYLAQMPQAVQLMNNLAHQLVNADEASYWSVVMNLVADAATGQILQQVVPLGRSGEVSKAAKDAAVDKAKREALGATGPSAGRGGAPIPPKAVTREQLLKMTPAQRDEYRQSIVEGVRSGRVPA